MTTLHLHHLENSRSFRILWLLEELKLPYQLTIYERTAAYLAPESLEAIHPLGKAPILEVCEDNGSDKVALVESAHIMDYLLAKYDHQHQFHPKLVADDKAWRHYDFWMHFAEASAMPPFVMRLIFSKIVERSPMVVKPVTKGIQKQVEEGFVGKNINKTLALIESHLSDNQWFAGGDFSAADIQMAFVLEAANAGRGLDRQRYANILNFIKRCQARDAYQQAVAKGGALAF